MTFRAAPAWLAVLLLLHPAFAWGPEGHRLIAQLAEKHLNAKARAEIARLLAPGESLASVASWADDVRPKRPETAPWHYINIPITAQDRNWIRYCAGNQCVVTAIPHFRALLADTTLPSVERAEALKFLVHFAGDIHQPLHCGDHQDRGGNQVPVLFHNRANNLHSVWDTPLLLEAERQPGWKDRVLRKSAFFERRRLARGQPQDWAWQSYEISRTFAYAYLPSARPASLPGDYAAKAAPYIELQIRRAGLRLAALLNQTLGR